MRSVLVPAVVLALVAGLAVGLWVQFLMPPRYLAAAVLLVPGTGNRSGANFLGLQGYQQLLESDEIVQRTAQRVSETFPDRSVEPEIGRELLTRRIGDGRGGPEAARLLRVEARGQEPDVTAALAETWVTVFLDKCADLADRGFDERTAELDEKLEEAEAEEALLTTERQRLSSLIDGSYQDAVLAWDRRLAEQRAAARRELATFDEETAELVAAFYGRHELVMRRLKVDALAETYRALMLEESGRVLLEEDDEPAESRDPESSEAESRFDPWRSPETGDDDGTGDDTSEAAEEPSFPESYVRSGDDLLEIRRKLMTKGDKVRRDEILLETLKRRRSIERQTLEERQETQRQGLLRERELALYAAADQQADQLLAVERDLRDTETVVNSLIRRRSNLDLKRGGCDVEIAAAAVKPARQEPRRTLIKALIGVLLGAALGLVLGLARHAGRAAGSTA
ncbi:MAG: hypothetical protein SX243_07740 [Acidobacteriota bacterium]|nr:hypothetical protein [Acidobacteriota bacterium]